MRLMATDWVSYHAGRIPGAPALESVETRDVITWSGLEDRVARLTGVLLDRCHVRRGDRVLLLSENDTRVFELQFACMRAGAILTPLNWRLALPELEFLTQDAAPSVVVHDAVWQESATRLAELGSVPLLSWGCRDTPLDYDLALEAATPVRAGRENMLDDPTHILYTSGTTGRPKGALSTWSTLMWQTMNIMQVDAIGGVGCKHFNPLPLFHAGGLNVLSNPLLLNGGCVTISRRFDPELSLDILGDPAWGITHFSGMPTIFQMMTELPKFEHANFSSLRHVQVAGGWAPASLAAVLAEKGITLQTHYGGTETGPAITAVPVEEAVGHPTSVGRAVMHTQVRLAAEDGGEVANGEVGEVWVSGPSITPGYWGRERAEDDAFVGSWFRTGDAATLDDDGFFYVVDRFKDMYKSGGENVFPAEVEKVIVQHPAIAEVAVIGVFDPKWGEVGRAIVVPRGDQEMSLAQITEHCQQYLARYKIPKSLVVLPELPRNTTGKVDKKILRAVHGIRREP
jgi:fatty-acyl-CoA synthase